MATYGNRNQIIFEDDELIPVEFGGEPTPEVLIQEEPPIYPSDDEGVIIDALAPSYTEALQIPEVGVAAPQVDSPQVEVTENLPAIDFNNVGLNDGINPQFNAAMGPARQALTLEQEQALTADDGKGFVEANDGVFNNILASITRGAKNIWEDDDFIYAMSDALLKGKGGGNFFSDLAAGAVAGGQASLARERQVEAEDKQDALDAEEARIKARKLELDENADKRAQTKLGLDAAELALKARKADAPIAAKDFAKIVGEAEQLENDYGLSARQAYENRIKSAYGSNFFETAGAKIREAGEASTEAVAQAEQPTPEEVVEEVTVDDVPVVETPPTIYRQMPVISPNLGAKSLRGQQQAKRAEKAETDYNEQKKAFSDKVNKSASKIQQSQSRGQQFLNSLLQEGDSLYTGPGGEWWGVGKSFVDAGLGDTGNIARRDNLKKLGSQLTLSARFGPDGEVLIGAQTSNFEIKIMKSTVPGLDKTPEANLKFIVLGDRPGNRSSAAIAYERSVYNNAPEGSYITREDMDALEQDRQAGIADAYEAIREAYSSNKAKYGVIDDSDIAALIANGEMPEGVAELMAQYTPDMVEGAEPIAYSGRDAIEQFIRMSDYVQDEKAVEARMVYEANQRGFYFTDEGKLLPADTDFYIGESHGGPQ